MSRRFVLRSAAVSAAAAALTLSWSAGLASGSAVPVSPVTSAYATPGCLALDLPQAPSLNYRNSEVEPQVAVSPTNGANLVGAWQQDRWSNGGAHGLVAGYTTNGGASWTVSPQPFSACYHASGYPGPYLNYQRASDPWVSIGPGAPGNPSGSTAYSVSISFDQTAYTYNGVSDPNALRNAVGAAASYDQGASWSNVQTIIADPCVSGTPSGPGYQCNNSKAYVFNDKESVTADPVQPGVAYAVWDRLVAPPASPQGFGHERAYFGQAYLSTTADYGRTWSTPRPITSIASQDQTIGNQIVVDSRVGHHSLYDFFNLIQNASNSGGHRGYSVAYMKSTDDGATWTKPSVVAPLNTAGVSDGANVNPYTNAPPAPSRTGDIIPEPAINSATGQLYVVWQDASLTGGHVNDQVAISTSSNGGTSWSAPEQVNVSAPAAFNPSVSVNPTTGAVGVTYLQWAATFQGNEPTSLNIQHSVTPGNSGAGPAFDASTMLDGPFNNLAAPVARGYFLGDYAGLVPSASGGFTAFYVKTNCSNGGPATQPSCRAIQSVLNPPGADRTPTDMDSTGVYAFPSS